MYVPLKELLNEREEEVNRALMKKVSLEDALEQPNTMKTEHKCEVQRLDDLYQQKAQELRKKMRSVPASLNSWRNTSERGPRGSHGCVMGCPGGIPTKVVLPSTEERRKEKTYSIFLR